MTQPQSHGAPHCVDTLATHPARRLTPEEIGRGIGDKDIKAIQYALNDLRAKEGLLGKPENGTWQLDDAGRRRAATL